MTLDLTRSETFSSVLLLADDLTMITGVWMVWFKVYWWYRNQARLVKLFGDLQARYRREGVRFAEHQQIRAIRRRYYLHDAAISTSLALCVMSILVTFTMQPFVHIDDRNLMYRAVFPWDIVDSAAGYWVACGLQLYWTFFVLVGILSLEVCGVVVVNQVTMYLHVLRVRWERMGEDCRIGGVDDDVDERSAWCDGEVVGRRRQRKRRMERLICELVLEHQSIMR